MSKSASKSGDTQPLPWDRFRGEPMHAYHAFRAYCEMDPRERTLKALQDILGGQGRSHPLFLLRRWSGLFVWKDRAKAFDDHLAQQHTQRWETRRADSFERSFQLSQKFHDRIQQMLDHPLTVKSTRTRNRDGQVVAITKIYPAKWNYGNLAALAQAAVQLETGSILAALAHHDGFDPRNATVEECRAYLVGRGILPEEPPALPSPSDPVIDIEPGPLPDEPVV